MESFKSENLIIFFFTVKYDYENDLWVRVVLFVSSVTNTVSNIDFFSERVESLGSNVILNRNACLFEFISKNHLTYVCYIGIYEQLSPIYRYYLIFLWINTSTQQTQ